ATRIPEAASGQRPDENASIAPSSQGHESTYRVSPEIKPTRTLTDEARNVQHSQTSRIVPLARATTPKSPVAPANDRPGLTATAADQSRRAITGPLVIRPQRLERADESNSHANEAKNDHHAPIIRVTIGRVDVRAVTQAAPTRPAPPPAPKL